MPLRQIAVILASAAGLMLPRQAPAQAVPPRAEHGGAIAVHMGIIDSLRFDPRFRHVATQRVVLGSAVDAEQHFFVHADDSGSVRAFYWLQLETMRSNATGRYEYPDSSKRAIDGIPFYTQVRRYAGAPPPDGDRGQAWALLERSGIKVPVSAIRARFIHLPDSSHRSEVMIIYVEPAAEQGAIDAPTERDVIERARRGFSVVRTK